MTIREQLHNSATHRPGADPACPGCSSDTVRYEVCKSDEAHYDADGRREGKWRVRGVTADGHIRLLDRVRHFYTKRDAVAFCRAAEVSR